MGREHLETTKWKRKDCSETEFLSMDQYLLRMDLTIEVLSSRDWSKGMEGRHCQTVTGTKAILIMTSEMARDKWDS